MVYGNNRYQRVRERLLRRIKADVSCPFCNAEFEENCEYTDVGGMGVQTTPNTCPNCRAYEQGAYIVDSETDELCDGWMRAKHEVSNKMLFQICEADWWPDGDE